MIYSNVYRNGLTPNSAQLRIDNTIDKRKWEKDLQNTTQKTKD